MADTRASVRVSSTAPLPGEAAPDGSLVDRAVRDLNELYTSKALETACQMGKYVVELFFGGNPELFKKRGRQHVSFRQLSRRQDLRVSASFLSTAVAVWEQKKLLPESVANRLPLAHHRLLLAVRASGEKRRLAERAVQEGLSKRELEAEVRARLGDAGSPHRRGRPPIPELAKRIGRLRRAAEEVGSCRATSGDFEFYSIPDRGFELAGLEEKLVHAARVIRALRERLAPAR